MPSSGPDDYRRMQPVSDSQVAGDHGRGSVNPALQLLKPEPLFPVLCQLLVGGIDEHGPSVYSVDAMGGATKEEDIVSTGSVHLWPTVFWKTVTDRA